MPRQDWKYARSEAARSGCCDSTISGKKGEGLKGRHGSSGGPEGVSKVERKSGDVRRWIRVMVDVEGQAERFIASAAKNTVQLQLKR